MEVGQASLDLTGPLVQMPTRRRTRHSASKEKESESHEIFDFPDDSPSRSPSRDHDAGELVAFTYMYREWL